MTRLNGYRAHFWEIVPACRCIIWLIFTQNSQKLRLYWVDWIQWLKVAYLSNWLDAMAIELTFEKFCASLPVHSVTHLHPEFSKVAPLLSWLDAMPIQLTFEKLCQPTGALCDSSTHRILKSRVSTRLARLHDKKPTLNFFQKSRLNWINWIPWLLHWLLRNFASLLMCYLTHLHSKFLKSLVFTKLPWLHTWLWGGYGQ